MPAAIYIETHGGAGVGGSDDHAGVDIGRTWTETPPASTPEEFLRRLRRGDAMRPRRPGQCRQVGARGDGARSPSARPRQTAARAPDPLVVLRIVERVMSQADARSGADRRRPLPRGRTCVAAGLARLARARHDWAGTARLDAGRRLCATPTCARRACRAHERSLREAVGLVVAAAADLDGGYGDRCRRRSSPPASPRSRTCPPPRSSVARRASCWGASRSRGASPWWPTASVRCTASRTRSTSCASAACPASRSR